MKFGDIIESVLVALWCVWFYGVLLLFLAFSWFGPYCGDMGVDFREPIAHTLSEYCGW